MPNLNTLVANEGDTGRYRGYRRGRYRALQMPNLNTLVANEGDTRFAIADTLVWTICTMALGLVTLAQATGVMLVDRVTKTPVKILMFCLALSVSILQLSYVLGFIKPALAVFSVGVFWHLFQSIYLIVSFIFHVKVE
jgi:hypothetical protein